ncbi:MAG: erythromycin esterase family protein [Phycisphaerales bacterium]|jgi:erythromycin esterase|nr:erythromycin esterase family protein [Phycisphaerales bacterium]
MPGPSSLVARAGLCVLSFLLAPSCPAQQAAPATAQPSPAAPDRTQVDWLRAHAAPISISPGEPDDLKDLASLKAAVGDSTMVLMGELTHGDAEAFALKVRLVKFLHQEMGFEVLVWESGLFDCEEMNDALAGDKPIANVARMGVFSHWSQGVESFPVFEYARSTQNTARRLRMSGFDIQNSGTAGWSMYPTFAEWLSDPLVISSEIKTYLESLFADARKMSQAADPQAEQRRIDQALRTLAPSLAEAHRSRRAEVVAAIGEREYGYRQRCLDNAVAFGEMMAANEKFQQSQSGEDFRWAYNVREAANAEVLLWLARERYPDRKLIVWCHNAHLFVGVTGLVNIGGADLPANAQTDSRGRPLNVMDSTGRALKQALGDKAYVLGVMAHSGTWSWLGNPPIDYAAAEPGSMEELLHAAGSPSCFLDLRPVRDEASHWLNQPRPGRINQQQPVSSQTSWPKAYDGILFIDRMTPRRQRP